MKRRRSSLRFKLSAFIVALSVIMAASVSAFLVVMRHREVHADLERKARVYGQLLSEQLEPAVGFDDQETAREVLNAAGSDPDVIRAALYATKDRLIEGSDVLPPAWPGAPDKLELRLTDGFIEVATPVVSREGPRGTLYLSIGTARAERVMQRDLMVTGAVVAALLLLAILAAWLIAGTVAYRLQRIAEVADRVAKQDFSFERLSPGTNDEVGRLTAGFNVMVDRLQHEQERMNQLVGERTRELESSREQYKQIIESTSAIPFEYDPTLFTFTYLGPQAVALLGYPMDAMRKPGFFRTIMDLNDSNMIRALASSAAVNGRAHDVETELRASDGRAVCIRIVTTPVPGHVRGLILDVTERKRLEAELGQAQKLESIGRLASGVAHEINTPVQFVSDSIHFVRDTFGDLLGLVTGYRELTAAVANGTAKPADVAALEKQAADADLDFVLENIPTSVDRALEGLERIAKIVKSMKIFAHPDQTERIAFDVNQGLESTVTIAKNEYKYVADLDLQLGNVPQVPCFPGEINQVFLNLIVNAAHSIGEKGGPRGCITVRSTVEPDRVVVSIGDTGCGIPEAIRGKVFDQFFTTKPVGKGTGQGLAIARSIVARHHGELTFESATGVGTTFFIRLPRTLGPVAVKAAA